MRYLVLSNVSGGIDRVVDLLQRSNVVAKESNMSTATLANDVGDQVRKGTYEQVIAVVKDPIAAGIFLNKQDGVQAAICDGIDDIKSARQNGANVIVIKNVDSDELGAMIAEVIGAGGIVQKVKLVAKMPQVIQKKVLAQPNEDDDEEEKPQKYVQKMKDEISEDEEVPKSNDGSIVGKIKNYLGII